MSREHRTSDHAHKSENAEDDRASPLKRVIQGLGLTLLGAAAALPVVCLYLTRRMLRREDRPLARKCTPARPPSSGSQPIRIPIHVPEAESSEATVPAEEPLTGAVTQSLSEGAPRYLASTESDKFHVPGCRWARQIRQEHRIELSDREDAQARGLIPCKTCNP